MTPSQELLNNARVLNEYLRLVKESAVDSSTVIPFFSTDSLKLDSLVYKVLRDAPGYGTFSETSANNHIQLITAVAREAGMAAADRSALYASALEESELEAVALERELFLQARVIDGKTEEQRLAI